MYPVSVIRKSAKWSALVVLLVFLLVPHAAWVGLSNYGLLKNSLVLLCAMAWMAGCLIIGRMPLFSKRFIGSLAAAFTLLLIPLFWAIDPFAGLGRVGQVLLILLFGLGAGALVRGHPKEVRTLLISAAVSSLVCCLHAFLQLWVGFDFPEQVRAPAAAFSNRNLLVHWLVLLWPGSLALSLSKEGVSLRALGMASALCTVVVILQMGAKAGLLALGVEGCVLLLINRFRVLTAAREMGRLKQAITGAVLIMVVPSSVLLWQMGHKRMGSVETEAFWRSDVSASVESRTSTWKNALQLLRDHPFGIGMAQFERIYPLYESEEQEWSPSLTRRQGHLHNDWLQLIVEGGVLMVPLLMIGLWLYAKALLRFAEARGLQVSGVQLQEFALCGIAGAMIISVFSFPHQSHLSLFLFFFFLGVVGAKASERDSTLTMSKPLKWALALIWVVSSGVLSNAQIRQIRADHLYYRLSGAFFEGNNKELETLGQRVLHLWPRHFMTQDLLGRGAIQTGDFEHGLELFNDLLKRWPHDPSYRYHQALALAGKGDSKSAVMVLHDLVQRYPENGALHFLYGTQLFACGEYEWAYTAFYEATRATPESALYAHNCGVAAELAGWNERAIEAYTYALKVDPEHRVSSRRLKALSSLKRE